MNFFKRVSDKQLNNLSAVASVTTAVLLIVLKAAAVFATGSLAVLSSMVDSISDVIASIVTLIAVRYAAKPVSPNHRYGYGKAEAVSSLVQAAFVIGSAGFILYDGINRLLFPVEIKQTTYGIVIIAISIFLTLLLISAQKYVAKKTGSLAIRADSAHYISDLLSNSAVILSLLAVKYLKIQWIDIIFAVFISFYLINCARKIAVEALEEITDREASNEIKQKISDAILSVEGVKGFHDLRSRVSGNSIFIELHLEFDGNMTLFATHDLSDEVEEKITRLYPNVQIIIHQDPYGIKEKRIDYDIDGRCLL